MNNYCNRSKQRRKQKEKKFLNRQENETCFIIKLSHSNTSNERSDFGHLNSNFCKKKKNRSVEMIN